MKDEEKLETGSIIWTDLTVPNAEKVKNFYGSVIGWKSEPVSMGEYNDFSMNSPDTGTYSSWNLPFTGS